MLHLEVNVTGPGLWFQVVCPITALWFWHSAAHTTSCAADKPCYQPDFRTLTCWPGTLLRTVVTMASSHEMEADPVQISSTSASDEAALQAPDVSFGLSVVPLNKQSSGSESSPGAASEGREVAITSNRPWRASGPCHRNKTAPKPKHVYACEVAKSSLTAPSSIPTSYGPTLDRSVASTSAVGCRGARG